MLDVRKKKLEDEDNYIMKLHTLHSLPNIVRFIRRIQWERYVTDLGNEFVQVCEHGN